MTHNGVRSGNRKFIRSSDGNYKDNHGLEHCCKQQSLTFVLKAFKGSSVWLNMNRKYLYFLSGLTVY